MPRLLQENRATDMRRYRILAAYGAVVLALFLAYHLSWVSQDDGGRSLAAVNTLAKAHLFEATLLFFAGAAILSYFSFPAMPLIYVAAGYCLGEAAGALAVLFGSAGGSLGAFMFYRRHIPERFCHASDGTSSTLTWLALLGLRLSPVVPAPLVNFFAVVSKVSPLQFLVTTLAGSAPLVMFYDAAGRQGREILNGQEADWRQLSIYFAILAVSTLLGALGPWRSFLSSIRHMKEDFVAAIRAPGE